MAVLDWRVGGDAGAEAKIIVCSAKRENGQREQEQGPQIDREEQRIQIKTCKKNNERVVNLNPSQIGGVFMFSQCTVGLGYPHVLLFPPTVQKHALDTLNYPLGVNTITRPVYYMKD